MGGGKNGFLNRATLALGLFVATATTALAQDPVPAAKKQNFFDKAEFDITIKSWHSDRRTPFNEWNPGILVKYPLPLKNMNVVEGVFKNSNFDASPICGVTYECNFAKNPEKLQMGFGIVVGFAGYGRKQKNTFDVKHIRLTERGALPKDTRRRGEQEFYMLEPKSYEADPSEDSLGAIEFKKTYCARSNKKIKPFGGALLMLSFMKNGFGLFTLGTYEPGIGIIDISGLRLKPGAMRKHQTYSLH